jgi:hypothetical protein
VYPRIHRGDTVLVVAHANVMRAIVRHLDIDTMSTAQLKNVRIPSAVPLIYDFTAGSGPGAPMRPTKTPSVLGMRGRYLTTYELIKHQLRVVDDKPDDNAAPAIVRPLTRADAFLDLLEHGLTHAQEYCDAVADLEAVEQAVDGLACVDQRLVAEQHQVAAGVERRHCRLGRCGELAVEVAAALHAQVVTEHRA